MSGTGPREAVFPTRQALTNTKLRLKSAQNGHSLLAKKRDALTLRFRTILKKVDEVRQLHILDAFHLCGTRVYRRFTSIHALRFSTLLLAHSEC